MSIPFLPVPQRFTRLSAPALISRRSPVTLRMPYREERLLRAVSSLFDTVSVDVGSFALFSDGEDRTVPTYEWNRPEGYFLSIRASSLHLVSQDAAGLYYGIQTLKQWFQITGGDAEPAGDGPVEPFSMEPFSMEVLDWPDLAIRSDYLDMRGLYPKYEAILAYVEEMAHYKLNTLVVEYEDKLPRDRTEFCHREEAWTHEQLSRFLKTARDHFIEIIPLQQSFGHLEYALKLPQYRYLRETPSTPGEMCPFREGAYELAASLIEETAKAHPDSRYIHLGCDEVWSLGESPECRESGMSRHKIAVNFINRLVDKAISLHKIPIVWHDMMADADMEDLARLDHRLIVAVWLYSSEQVNKDAPVLMERLHAAGLRTLPCCAVRASDMVPHQNYPQVEQRLRNIDAWISRIGCSRANGMISTNWCSTFSLGNPYGLFETSRYTALYAAMFCWNLNAPKEDFLERFLTIYHGVAHPRVQSGPERRYDYYKVIGEFLPQATRHKKTAELIALMRRLEYATPVNATAFRGDFFPDSEVELACLRERAPSQYQAFHQICQDLRELLSDLLSPRMADLFLESRVYPVRLFQTQLERILDMPLSDSSIPHKS